MVPCDIGRFRRILYSSGGWREGWTPHVLRLNGDALSDVLLYNEVTGDWVTCISGNAGLTFDYGSGGWAPGWQIHALRSPLALAGGDADDLLLYNSVSGNFFTLRNLGSHGWPSYTTFQANGTFGTDFRLAVNRDVAASSTALVLYRPNTGQMLHANYLGTGLCNCYPFVFWQSEFWPAGLEVTAAGDGFRIDGDESFFLYDKVFGLYDIAVSTSFGTHPFLYYIGQFDPGLKTLVADYSGDGRDDVVLYDSLAGGLTVALNRGPSPAFAWMGFDLFFWGVKTQVSTSSRNMGSLD